MKRQPDFPLSKTGNSQKSSLSAGRVTPELVDRRNKYTSVHTLQRFSTLQQQLEKSFLESMRDSM